MGKGLIDSELGQCSSPLPVKHFLANKSIPVLEHSHYSPDLASCYFYSHSVRKVKADMAGLSRRVITDPIALNNGRNIMQKFINYEE